MRSDALYPEPPSIVESESGWKEKHPVVEVTGAKDEDFVVLSSLGTALVRDVS